MNDFQELMVMTLQQNWAEETLWSSVAEMRVAAGILGSCEIGPCGLVGDPGDEKIGHTLHMGI